MKSLKILALAMLLAIPLATSCNKDSDSYFVRYEASVEFEDEWNEWYASPDQMNMRLYYITTSGGQEEDYYDGNNFSLVVGPFKKGETVAIKVKGGSYNVMKSVTAAIYASKNGSEYTLQTKNGGDGCDSAECAIDLDY